MALAKKKLERWTWYPFTKSNLDLVPSIPGVYCLGVDSQIIYIGSAKVLYARLSDHYTTSDPCIKKASQFSRNQDPRPMNSFVMS